jgi:hypothetical protein
MMGKDVMRTQGLNSVQEGLLKAREAYEKHVHLKRRQGQFGKFELYQSLVRNLQREWEVESFGFLLNRAQTGKTGLRAEEGRDLKNSYDESCD